MRPLSFGFKTPQQHTDFDTLDRLWQAGDEHPAFDHAWLFDHFAPVAGAAPGACLEGWTLLSALAARTGRLRTGLLVSGNTHRHPAVLAHMLATVDQISVGRTDFGFGAGWNAGEHRSLGLELFGPAERLARWDEACQVIKLLYSGKTVDFHGRHYQLRQARLDPHPRRRPPFVLGAIGDRALAVVARHADVWNLAGGHLTGLAAKTATLARHCARIGRDPEEITRSTQLHVDGDDLMATRSWAERFIRLGVRHLVFVLPQPYHVDQLHRIADQIIEPLRLRHG